MAEQARVRYRYTGDGTQYLNDVPGRDLTREDWATLTAEQKAAVRASALYERATGDEEPADEAEQTPPRSGGAAPPSPKGTRDGEKE